MYTSKVFLFSQRNILCQFSVLNTTKRYKHRFTFIIKLLLILKNTYFALGFWFQLLPILELPFFFFMMSQFFHIKRIERIIRGCQSMNILRVDAVNLTLFLSSRFTVIVNMCTHIKKAQNNHNARTIKYFHRSY